MKINRIWINNMVQGTRQGSDLSKIIFSPLGDKIVSIGKSYLALLWDTTTQTIIKEFKELIAHHVAFTPDGQGLILINNQQLYYYNLTTLKEIYNVNNGIKMGLGECTPDNLFFIYTNNTNLYVRSLQNFQLIHYTSNSTCQPFFPIFHIPTNVLYTTSEKAGKLCKWNLSTYQVQAMVTLNATVSDMDFTDKYLVVSTTKNRRLIYLVNPYTLKIINSKVIPKSNFLDVNTQIHSTYAEEYDLILSVAIPGDFLFKFNASTFQFLSPAIKFPINTYTVTYDENRKLIALGGQIANKITNQIEDQVLIYQFQKNCSNIPYTVSLSPLQTSCKCQNNFYWNNTIQSCQKMDCQLDNKGLCRCPSNQKWNIYTMKCEWVCQQIPNSFQSLVYGNNNICACKQGYRWDELSKKCRKIVKCEKVINSIGNKNLFECNCQEKYVFSQVTETCNINCQQIEHTNSQMRMLNNFNISKDQCKCQFNYKWNSQKFKCEYFVPQNYGVSSEKPYLLISIIIPIVFTLISKKISYIKKCKNPQTIDLKTVSSSIQSQGGETPKIIIDKNSIQDSEGKIKDNVNNQINVKSESLKSES